MCIDDRRSYLDQKDIDSLQTFIQHVIIMFNHRTERNVVRGNGQLIRITANRPEIQHPPLGSTFVHDHTSSKHPSQPVPSLVDSIGASPVLPRSGDGRSPSDGGEGSLFLYSSMT